MSEPLVTEWAKQQARDLAGTAVVEDGWMSKVFSKGDPLEFDDFQCKHRASWEETCHWQIKYGRKLEDMAEIQQIKEDNFDLWYAAYEVLKDEFWDEWECQQGFLKFWKRSVGYVKEKSHA